jgi:Rha family phage regulatory protein
LNNLTIINHNGQLAADSRQVAEMVEKQHKDLLESIRGYIDTLSGKFRSVDFFIPHTYQDSTGRTLPCYLLTRKGCDMVANKMTGEKGVLFTAAYVTKFVEMEKKLAPACIEDILIRQLQQMKQVRETAERALIAAESAQNSLTAVKETFLQRDEPWRENINKMLNRIARDKNEYQFLRADTYQQLERRAGCDLNTRLRNLKERATKHGIGKTKIDALNRLDVIENDKKLKEIYTTIVKEMALARV